MAFEMNLSQGFGYSAASNPIRVTAKETALGIGACFSLDLPNTYATSNIIGSRTSGFSTAVLPTAGSVKYGIVGITSETIALNGTGNAVTEGIVNALVTKLSGDITPGEPLYAVTGSTALSADGNVGDRVVAMSTETVTAPSAPTLAQVFFSGVTGLGQKVV